MVVMIPTDKKSETKLQTEVARCDLETAKQESKEEWKQYKEELEKQLKVILGKIQGCGDCGVMITFSDDGRVYLDKDLLKQEGEGIFKSEQKSVVYRQSEKDAPFVIRQDRPKVEGVVVVAEGGEHPQAKISEVLMSLFDLEMHKITVVKMSVQEE